MSSYSLVFINIVCTHIYLDLKGGFQLLLVIMYSDNYKYAALGFIINFMCYITIYQHGANNLQTVMWAIKN